MAHVTAIIPARLESKRFSRKVLYPLNGRPLIFYVWRAARRARLINRLFVATDSAEIGRAVNGFGGAVIMTSKKPRNGTERAAEAISDMRTDIVINIQADNLGPFGPVLDRVLKSMMNDKKTEAATLARKIDGRNWRRKLENPDVVKVIENARGDAAWFSRYPIPYIRGVGRRRSIDLFPFLEHIGVYFFRRKALLEYASWPQGRIEKAESLEQLRILEHGKSIRLYKTSAEIVSVDNKESLHAIKSI
jgi:3-deoxy-manno-octulosonate cytidylyltransferase (CMP-KDO synthetase)